MEHIYTWKRQYLPKSMMEVCHYSHIGIVKLSVKHHTGTLVSLSTNMQGHQKQSVDGQTQFGAGQWWSCPWFVREACGKMLGLAIFEKTLGLSSSCWTFSLGKGMTLASEILQVDLEV